MQSLTVRSFAVWSLEVDETCDLADLNALTIDCGNKCCWRGTERLLPSGIEASTDYESLAIACTSPEILSRSVGGMSRQPNKPTTLSIVISG